MAAGGNVAPPRKSFVKLSDRLFTKNIKSYRIYDLEELFGAVNYVFQQCQFQLLELSDNKVKGKGE